MLATWTNFPACKREKEKEREGVGVGERKREREYLFLKGITGALEPFSYLVS